MMISRAGGMTEDAAPRVVLIPGPTAARERMLRAKGQQEQGVYTQSGDDEARANPDETAAAAALPGSGKISQAKFEGARAGAQQVIIRMSRPEDQRYLNMPAQPGDVIIVPPAGEVTVQGWVDKPGAFKISPGMTAMGSIAAAGGALFSSKATLLREQSGGGKLQIPLDLSSIKSGRQPDVPVQGGDIVVVERSTLGAIPYSAYYLVQRVGIGLPIPY